MLRVCRRVACLLLATDSCLAVRWIPSERNVADQPSRKWEHLRREDALTRKQKDKIKEGILDACYPSGATGDSSGWVRHAHSATSGGRARDQEQKAKSGEGHFGPHSTSEDDEAPTEGGGTRRWCPISRSDSSRDDGCVETGGPGLPEADHRIEALRPKREAESDKEVQLRLGLLQVCEQHVQPRLRVPGRLQNIGGHHRRLSRLRPSAHVVPNTKGPARMAKGGATTDQAPVAMAFDRNNLHGTAVVKAAHHSSRPSSDVHCLLEARRDFGCTDRRPHPTHARKPLLCSATTSHSSRTAVKGGAFRRVPDAGFSTFAMVGEGSSKPCTPSNISPGSQLRSHGKELEMGFEKGGPSREPCSSISNETLRAQLRSAPKASIPARKMGLRSQRQEVRSTCKNRSGIPQSSTGCAKPLHQDGEDFPQGGPKVFPPEGQAIASSKKYVLEIFSGCARLSRACAQKGFFCIAYDIEYGDLCDLLNSKVVDSLCKFTRKHAHEIALVWFGTPCTTWSRARKNDGGPRPLRDDDSGLMGLAGLSVSEQHKVDEGNRLLQVTVGLCKLRLALNISWVIENPFSSRIWLTDDLQSLLLRGAKLICADFCAYGMPWKKSTGFLVFGFGQFSDIAHVCQSANGRCQHTGRKHIILTGKDATGLWMTRRAQPYPLRLCAAIATLLHDHIRASRESSGLQ